VDQPLSIRALKRFAVEKATDTEMEKDETLLLEDPLSSEFEKKNPYEFPEGVNEGITERGSGSGN